MKGIDQHLLSLPRRAEYEDIDAVRELASRQGVRFEQLGNGRMRSSYALLTTRNLHISESRHSVGAIARGAVGKDLCLIGVRGDEGPEGSTFGPCSDEDCVLVRSGEEYFVSSRRSFRTLSVALSQARLEAAAEATWGVSLRVLAPGYRLGLYGPAARRWLHRQILALVTPGDVTPGPSSLQRRTEEATEDAIIHAILSSVRVRSPQRRDPGRIAYARRAERMIRELLADDLCITRCATELGVPLRTLELGFRDLHGVSLRAYRYALRLNAARRDLLRPGGQETVGEVAVRWGLNHLGRFSTDYRRMFGESPSETRERARV